MTARRHSDSPSVDQFAGLPLLEGAAAIAFEPITRRTRVRAHLRRVEGPPLPSGEQQKQEALAKHELSAAKTLAKEYVRARLVELYRSRDNDPMRWPVAYVNGDDISSILRKWAQCPAILHEITGHWKGTVFKKGFAQVRGLSHPSLRGPAKGSSMPAWRPLP